MRILHVVPTYLPAVRYGGPIVSVHGLCKALVRRGHDVHVFTTNVDGQDDSAVPLDAPVNVDGVSVWYFRVPVLRRLYWSPLMRRALRQHMGTFDLAHAHSVFSWPTWEAARTARRCGVPYVVSPKGMLVKELVRRRSRLLKSAWIRLIEQDNLERAASIQVTSTLEAEELAAFGFKLPPIAVVPNGVDVSDAYESKAPSTQIEALVEGRPYLLFLGRINWKKGLDRLIEALDRIREVRLIVAGNDEEGYQEALEALAAQRQVADRIRFIGPAYGTDKQVLISHAIALMVPSYSENFGNVVLEAMAAGCPVVTTPEVGAASIVSESSAGIVVDGSPESLAAGLKALLDAPESARAMGQRARDIVAARYTWDVVALSIEKLYNELSPKPSG